MIFIDWSTFKMISRVNVFGIYNYISNLLLTSFLFVCLEGLIFPLATDKRQKLPIQRNNNVFEKAMILEVEEIYERKKTVGFWKIFCFKWHLY